MSQPILYLVPKMAFPAGTFRARIEHVLHELHVIDGLYDQEYGWLAAGRESGTLFQERGSTFEYAEIRDAANWRMVPEGVGPDLKAFCSSCTADVGTALYEAMGDFYSEEGEPGQSEDMAMIEVVCSACNKRQMLSNLKLEPGRMLVKQFIQFVEIESAVDDAKLLELEKLVGCEFSVLYE